MAWHEAKDIDVAVAVTDAPNNHYDIGYNQHKDSICDDVEVHGFSFFASIKKIADR